MKNYLFHLYNYNFVVTKVYSSVLPPPILIMTYRCDAHLFCDLQMTYSHIFENACDLNMASTEEENTELMFRRLVNHDVFTHMHKVGDQPTELFP